MSENIYMSLNGVAQQCTNLYWGDNNGVVRKIVSGQYGNQNGVAQLIYSTIPQVYAMSYTDGNLIFQYGNIADTNRTLYMTYIVNVNGYPSTSAVPWYVRRGSVKHEVYIGDIDVKSKANWFYWFKNLTGSPMCGDNVENMYQTYYNCHNITGSPVCGPNVIDMSNTYRNCYNLTGSAACSNSVINMRSTYYRCNNLTGSPACGNNVINMYYTYFNCNRLAGSPVCGNNVIDMSHAYENCYKLTGFPACGPNVINMANAYQCCPNLSAGDQYWYSKNVSNVKSCFTRKNNSRQYNIHCCANSTTFNTLLINSTLSLVGAAITWTNAGTYHYNTAYNIYIYPDLTQSGYALSDVLYCKECTSGRTSVTYEEILAEGLTPDEWECGSCGGIGFDRL